MKPKTPFEEIDHKSILKRMIILCWVCLGVCLLVKIFGGKSFEIIVTNERFIEVCGIIDSHLPILFIIHLFSYTLTSSLFFLSIIPQTSKKFILLYLVLFIIKNVSMDYESIIGDIIETVAMIGIPILYKVSLKDSIKHYIIVFIFQLTSVLIRNIAVPHWPDSALCGLIMSIDYHIMMILLCLYYKQGGLVQNG